MYKVIALMGRSGVGKDSVLKEILKIRNDFNRIVSYTTRPKRENEIEGKDYLFISPNRFTQEIYQGNLVECTEFNDWFYGTPYSSLKEDKINIGIFSPDAVDQLCADKNINLEIVLIVCSAKTMLLRQLNREENPDVDEIIRRYKADNRDFDHIEQDFENISIVSNDGRTVKNCAKGVLKALKGKIG